MIPIFILILGALNNAFTQMGYNGFTAIDNFLFNYFKFDINIQQKFYIFVGLCAIIVALDKSIWLPFLSDTVFPSSLVPLMKLYGNTNVKVEVSPLTKVAFWTTIPNFDNKKPYYKAAYNNYENSGVVMSDKDGIAELVFNKGTGYILPSGTYLEPHVHYREFLKDGFLGPVKTVYL